MATKKYVSLEKLGLYDEKIKKVISDGDAAVEAAAKAYADGLASNYDAAGAAATVQGKLDEEVARAKAAEEAAQAAADKAQEEVDALELVVQNIQENAYDDSELRGLIDGLEEDKADKTQVATDIAAAVKAETDARVEAVAGVQGTVDTLSQTHATDKKALEDAIALKADATALAEVSAVANAAVKQADYDVKVKALEDEDTRIVGLVEAEAERAAGVESGLEGRIETMEAFWEAAQADGTDSNVIDTLKEIQDYIAGDETGASEMAASIKQNTDAISAMDTAYKAADTTLQGNIDDLAAVVDGKAAAADVKALEGRMDTAEADIDAVEGRLDTAEADIDALQALFGEGEGSVSDQIADAVADEAALREKGDEDAIAAAAEDATTKANAAQAAAIAKANELNTAMDARVGVVEAKAHEHANKALLDTYTQTEANLADAVAKKHAHSNLAVLEGITAEKVTAWDKVTGKAEQTALQAEIDRATAAEQALSARIDEFVECSQEDINNLFVTA